MLLRAKILLAVGATAVAVAAYAQPRGGLVLLAADASQTAVLEPASVRGGQVAVHQVYAQPQATAWGAARTDRRLIAVDCARSMSRTTQMDVHGEDGALLHSEAVDTDWTAPGGDSARRDTIRFVCDAAFAKAANRASTHRVSEIKRRYLAALRQRRA
jgi:hypothetical protein